MQKFDLIVIGGGSGLDVAAAASEHGLKVAIVEHGPLGGTCLNRGCIPSKMLIHSADVVETLKKAHLFGINVQGYAVDFPAIVKRVTEFVDHDSRQIERSLRATSNPLLFKETCRFVRPKTLQVGTETITAEKILLASGGRPTVPNIPGLRQSGFITSDEALRLQEQPKVMTILGGGYIAAELAHFFGALGTSINIIQRSDILLDKEDREIATRFTELAKQRYNVYTSHEATGVSREGTMIQVTIRDTKSGHTKTLKSDQLLVAAGRTPNSDLLEVDKTGVKTDQKGYVITDRFLETNVKGIFCLGDANGHYLFKHAANLEAEYAFTNILHDKKVAVDYKAMPHAIFTSPQIAGVGKTEQEVIADRTGYLVGRYNYIDTAMGEAIEDQTGMVKILVEERSSKILGCHIIGTEASILIHEVIVAMKSGEGTINNITNAVHIHPALNEVVQRASYSLQQASN
jgi:dihydrolipoamide dehydrogenase